MSKFYQDFPCLAKCCLAFFGCDAKSLAWVFLARRVLPFVLGFFCCLFWGRCQIPRLGVSCSSGAAFRVCCVFFAFFWGRCQIPRLGVSCSSGAAFRAWVLLLHFLGAMPNPSLGCFLLVGCCLSCLGSFVAFFGGDAKSLAWVFLACRVLPFVFGFFFGLFWGRCQIPRLGVSCSSGAY